MYKSAFTSKCFSCVLHHVLTTLNYFCVETTYTYLGLVYYHHNVHEAKRILLEKKTS